MIYVVDASVIAKWYIPEVLSLQANTLMNWILREGHTIAAPELFLSEMANILWKKSALLGEISPPMAFQIFGEIQRMGVRLFPDRLLLERALKVAIDYRAPVYDTLYLTLAEQLESSLITADQRITKRFKSTQWFKKIILLSHWEAEH